MGKMGTHVLLVGGFIFSEEYLPTLKDFLETLKKISKKEKIVVVAGGGKLARQLVKKAEKLGLTKTDQDILGIYATRINGILIKSALSGRAHGKVASTLNEVEVGLKLSRIVVCGGMFPGQSTDTVGTLIAEKLNVKKIIKMTDVEGVYAEDSLLGRTRLLEKLSYKEFQEIISKKDFEPGKYELFDPIALRIAERSKIKVLITDGRKPRNLRKIIKGSNIGTIIG